MNKLRWLCATALACAFVTTDLLAQGGGTVTGTVTAEGAGQPVASAQIIVQGTARRAVTDAQGRYTISNIPAGTYTVTATQVGRETVNRQVTVAAGQTATQNFTLATRVIAVEGLVVQATGRETREREIGNAVASITAAEVPIAAVGNVSEFLQARAPGVSVIGASGQLGGGSRIRIRGSNSLSLSNEPLLIIDGVRVLSEPSADGLFTGGQQTSRFEDLNPEDIESVEVLKGPAAAALYGTQAANGVIQVTTKRGRAGRPQVRAYAERATLQNTFDVPDNVLARGVSATGARVDCDFRALASGGCVRVDSIYRYNPLASANTPLRDGAVNKFGMSVSGGTEGVTYYVSADNEDGEGTQNPNNLRRTNVRANTSANLGSSLRLTASAGFHRGRTQLPQSDNSAVSPFLQGLRGSPSPSNVASNGGYNAPILASDLFVWENLNRVNRFTGSLRADWNPLSWLSFNGTVGLDDTDRFTTSFVAAEDLPTFFPGGFREQYRLSDDVLTVNGGATVTREFGGSVVSTTSTGVQYNAQGGTWTFAAADQIAPGTKTGVIPSAVQEDLTATDRLFGTYVTQQFGFRDRLFLTAGVRADKNLAFGSDIGWVTYPTFSGSWVVNEEPFFPQTDAVSNLRLRAAYGKSGVRPGRLDAAQTFTTRQAVDESGNVIPGFVISNFGNSELEAEVTREIELGTDVGLFDDRVVLEVTGYDKQSENALVSRTLPPSLGGPGSQFFNLGSVENRGLEIGLRTEPIRSERVSLNLGMNFTRNRNKLITFGDTSVTPISITAYQYHVEGLPLGAYFAPAYTFADANNDKLIQTSEVKLVPKAEQTDSVLGRSFLGSPFPTREMSFNADLRLSNVVRVTGLLDYKGGHKIYNSTAVTRCAGASGSYCEYRQEPGMATLEQQAAVQALRVLGTQAGFIEDASFMKLREVSLTLTTPTSWLRNLGVDGGQSVALTIAGRNLHTWTDYTGFDPEVNFGGPTNFSTADVFTLPAPRSVTARIDVSF